MSVLGRIVHTHSEVDFDDDEASVLPQSSSQLLPAARGHQLFMVAHRDSVHSSSSEKDDSTHQHSEIRYVLDMNIQLGGYCKMYIALCDCHALKLGLGQIFVNNFLNKSSFSLRTYNKDKIFVYSSTCWPKCTCKFWSYLCFICICQLFLRIIGNFLLNNGVDK